MVDGGGGLLTRRLARQVVSTETLDAAVRARHLCRVLPQVYVDADLLDTSKALASEDATDLLGCLDPELRRRAVIMYADGRGALSHTSALDVWGLRRQPGTEPLHLSVPETSGVRGRAGLVVHQRRGFVVDPPQVLLRSQLPVTRIELALVEAWPLLPSADRPAPLIRAVNDRATTPDRVGTALRAAPKLIGRAELRRLVDLLAAGCRSALEIWGHDHVFTDPYLPPLRRQVRVQVARHTMYLDVYAERERVNFELDGAASHGDPRQREIDLRRDATLATLGIQVVRFAHRRLVHETTDVRREIRAILTSRRPPT